MPGELQRRPMTDGERAHLEAFLAKNPSRFKRALKNAWISWAALMLLFVVVWALVGNRGTTSQWSPQVTLIAAAAAALIAVLMTLRWLASWKDVRPQVRSDLSGGLVSEERLQFTEAKRFQEPEHGGLIYFLHSTDDRVFVLYDHESQDLGVDGRKPLESSFRPHAELVIVRAPESRFVLSTTFTGAPLELSLPRKLAIPPAEWPDTEEFYEAPWGELEQRLSHVAPPA